MSRSPFWRDPFVADPPKEDAYEVWGTVAYSYGSHIRPRPLNAQHEPPYPAHETVTFSLRDPDMVIHRATARCAQEAPHKIESCGEFTLVIVHPLPDHDRL